MERVRANNSGEVSPGPRRAKGFEIKVSKIIDGDSAMHAVNIHDHCLPRFIEIMTSNNYRVEICNIF